MVYEVGRCVRLTNGTVILEELLDILYEWIAGKKAKMSGLSE